MIDIRSAEKQKILVLSVSLWLGKAYGVTRRFEKCATVPGPIQRATDPLASPCLRSLTSSVGRPQSWTKRRALDLDFHPGPPAWDQIDIGLVFLGVFLAKAEPRKLGE
jgi:hypothetical protein